MNLWSEFVLTESLKSEVKTYRLEKTLSRNMVKEGVYCLSPFTLDSLTRLTQGFQKTLPTLQLAAEEALETLSVQHFNLTVLEGLQINLNHQVFQSTIKVANQVQIIPRTVKTIEEIETSILEEVPELFWVINLESPLLDLKVRDVVLLTQYLNYLKTLV